MRHDFNGVRYDRWKFQNDLSRCIITIYTTRLPFI